MADLYERLGVQRSASTDEIKKAYRNLAKEKHPDRGGNPDEFKAIQEAQEILTDEGRRRMYDATGSTKEGGNPMDGMAAGGIPFSFMGGMGPFGMPGVQFDMGDMFGNLFGGGGGKKPRAPRGPNKFHDVGLTLADFYAGREIKLKFNQARRCTACNASGAEHTEMCGGCGGSGVRMVHRMIAPGMMAQTRGICDVCNGEGHRILRACRGCQGKKFIEREKHLDIKIVPGMREGETLSFAGECSDSLDYDIPGDAVLTLRRSDMGIGETDEYMWKDNDLMVRKSISFKQSVLGFSFTLEDHPNGKSPTVVWEDGPLVHGAVVQIVGLGMPKKNGGYGNLLLQVMVEPPPVRKWTDAEKASLSSALGTVTLVKTPESQTCVISSSTSKLVVEK